MSCVRPKQSNFLEEVVEHHEPGRVFVGIVLSLFFCQHEDNDGEEIGAVRVRLPFETGQIFEAPDKI